MLDCAEHPLNRVRSHRPAPAVAQSRFGSAFAVKGAGDAPETIAYRDLVALGVLQNRVNRIAQACYAFDEELGEMIDRAAGPMSDAERDRFFDEFNADVERVEGGDDA